MFTKCYISFLSLCYLQRLKIFDIHFYFIIKISFILAHKLNRSFFFFADCFFLDCKKYVRITINHISDRGIQLVHIYSEYKGDYIPFGFQLNWERGRRRLICSPWWLLVVPTCWWLSVYFVWFSFTTTLWGLLTVSNFVFWML